MPKDRIYNGPFPSVELALGEPLEDGSRQLIALKGELCEEIPDSMVTSLDQQGDWLLPNGELPEAANPAAERVYTKAELKAVAEGAGIEVPAKATKAEIEELIADHAKKQDAEGESGVQDPDHGDQVSGEPDTSTTAPSGE